MSFYDKIYRAVASPLRRAYRVTVTGAEKLPQGRGCIICANHTSMSDVLVLSVGLDRQIRYMAKKELFKIPLLGGLIRALGAYPVERGAADVASVRRSIALIESGELIGIFPQGTRRPYVDPATTEVKSGVGMLAYRSHCDVVPAYLKTKKNKTRLFCRTELIVGDTIKYDELGFENGGMNEYSAATRLVFERVCALAGEAENGN